MEPYESTYVGSFIFTLGYVAHESGLALHDRSVCLLAQNKGDQVIGDLIQQWNGRSFIIEFKRNEQSVRTEFDKPHKRKLLEQLACFPKDHPARQGHFLAFGAPEVPGRASIHVMHYMAVENAPKQRGVRLDADKFIRHVLSDPGSGFTPETFPSYLELLHKNAAESSAGGGTARQPLAALIVNRGEDGQIRFITCDVTRTHEITLELGRGPEPERDVRSWDRSRDRGWSR